MLYLQVGTETANTVNAAIGIHIQFDLRNQDRLLDAKTNSVAGIRFDIGVFDQGTPCIVVWREALNRNRERVVVDEKSHIKLYGVDDGTLT